ncbi:hypothetical protein PVK06_040795 [Gossypium arboreum]|uniref:NADH-ubiquinone oxidoreductase chain 4 n=1 Tax=Gossypium arboreum TaxID=29729 RepID=A0ABR0N9A2_GOSAR|nr:hypothetical protein PVK06_040795 [Gossypium arboreum]
MLLAILLILLQTGTTDLQISLTTEFSERRQIFLWIASFASFAVKVPMVPVHIWLLEAHVEAPTAGSVILAGIPLKLGTYGFLRFSIPMFPEATLCFTPFIYTLSAIAIIYTSLTTSRQIDLKKIIAYSSVAHMNLSGQALFRPAQFSYPSVQCTGLISWREKPKCSCVVVVRRFDAFPSLPGIVPHRKKERRAAARPVANTRPVQRERAAQTNVSCYTESPAGHRGPSAREKQAKYKLCQKQDEEAKLSELYKADHYISRWRKKLLRASFHSLRGSRTAHSWKSEGPYYLPNPSLRGTVDQKAPSKPPHSSKREGKGPMYLHDPCRFYPIYTRSQSPIGPATTPQNESSCGTFYLWRNSGGT